MAKKLDKNLIGLKKEIFDSYINSSPIQLRVQPARLIPALKTGDEMALTSIFLSTLRLVKEYRDSIWKQSPYLDMFKKKNCLDVGNF